MRELEDRLDQSPDDAAIQKMLKKHLDGMIEYVANVLFGVAVVNDIRKPPPRHSGPMCKFFKPSAKLDSAEAQRRRSLLEVAMKEAKNKCNQCRGGDAEDEVENCKKRNVTCVQRDCPNLFKIALLCRDIEELDSL